MDSERPTALIQGASRGIGLEMTRLLLADGCSYAARVLKADTVIDAATLTGAQGVATGAHFSAVVSNDAEVEQALAQGQQLLSWTSKP